jgi:hypothetical protein
MARSINSPGVQIVETDLSLYQQVGGGTNVLVPGYAAQGPIDEILLISSASELEQVYGAPETPAERYFFYSCKEILNSPATLLTTRLPYGSGSGVGFSTQYSALLYPVASASEGFTVGEPTHITLTEEQYDLLLQNNFTWSSLNGTASVQTTGIVLSSVTATPETSAAIFAGIQAVDPTPNTYSIEYLDSGDVTFTFQVSGVTTTESVGTTASFVNGEVAAGIVILNSSQTTVNEAFEGYYVSLADNTDFGPNTDFTSVTTIKSLTSNGGFYSLPDTRVGFALSGTKESAGTNSISEVIESIPTYDFSSEFYSDSLILNVFKVRNSIYEPNTLTYSLAESHIGSLNGNRKTIADAGGVSRSFFIGDVANNTSNNIRVLVNPEISQRTNWSSVSSINPAKNVRIDSDNKTVYPVGIYSPTYEFVQDKEVGKTTDKLARALSLVETSETVLLDVVVDAGLTTISANASGTTDNGKYFNDSTFLDTAALSSTNSPEVERWRTTFNVFNNFVQNVRKDCVFIADPLRQIFVNGENTKTLSVRGNTFSTNIYTPLKNLFSSVNSNYATTYGNWLKTYDAYSDKQVWVPASGYVAAIFARTDTNTQPWYAPAGLNRGTINNITDIAFNPNQKQRDFLYTISINPIVLFSGDGFVVFGQKTLQNKPSAFDRINVRRLFLTLERTVMNSVKYFVFEPNTEFTRTRLKNTITPVFELAKNTEGLYDYLIVCDERNNTPDVIDRNELAVDVYIKPVKTAEFILVNFIATRTGQNFQELI